MKQNRAVTRGADPRAREARLIEVFTDDRSRSGHLGPPAFVLGSRARVALEVIDKLTENVEMVAWLIRVAARRRARRIHCVFVL